MLSLAAIALAVFIWSAFKLAKEIDEPIDEFKNRNEL